MPYNVAAIHAIRQELRTAINRIDAMTTNL